MANNNDLITVKQGQLRGKTEFTDQGFKFYSFLGIPYAKPPIGKLRFRNPEPADKWQGTRDATQEGDNCYSNDILLHECGGSEDCLFLNIFTPELPASSCNQRAVMVWIHGGGYLFGSSKRKQYGPEYLIDKDIVLVTINYRLGALGFLCLDDKTLSVCGNAGMHDQVLALKWVQENIAAFGGDPGNVTIFGESAGAASVHLHMLSRMSTGLFHKAILQSGTSVCPWSFGQSNGLILASMLGLDTKNEEEALNFLQYVPVEKLIEAQNKIPDLLFPDLLRYFAPVVEPPHNGPIFLHDNPETILESGHYNKVDILLGYNSEEGLIFKMLENQFNFTDFEQVISHRYRIAKGSTKSAEIARRIKEFYYGDDVPNQNNKDIFYKLLSHSVFVRSIHFTIEETLKNSNEKLYFYILSLDCELNQFSKLMNIKSKDVCHAEDLFYLFYHNQMSPQIKPGSIEDVVIQRMTKWWTNFAKYSNPNGVEKDPLLHPEWPMVDLKTLQCLDVNTDVTIRSMPEGKYMKFWKSIEEYARSE